MAWMVLLDPHATADTARQCTVEELVLVREVVGCANVLDMETVLFIPTGNE